MAIIDAMDIRVIFLRCKEPKTQGASFRDPHVHVILCFPVDRGFRDPCHGLKRGVL